MAELGGRVNGRRAGRARLTSWKNVRFYPSAPAARRVVDSSGGLMRRTRYVFAALLGARRGRARARATGTAAKQARRSRRRGSTSGRTTTRGWSQAHDMGRLYVQKALGTKVQTTYKENIAERRAAAAGGREPRPRRQQDHLRDLVRLLRQDARREEVPGRATSSRRPGRTQSKNLAEYFGAGEDSIYLSGMAAGAATKNGKIGYVVAVRDPRGDPARERVRARRAGDATRAPR